MQFRGVACFYINVGKKRLVIKVRKGRKVKCHY